MSVKEDMYARMANLFGKHFEHVLLEGLESFFAAKERDEGAYLLDIIQHSFAKVDAISKKGIPKPAIFPTFAQLVRNDKVYISPDGNKYSLIKLPDYLLFSEIIKERMQGYAFDYEKSALVEATAPTLDFVKTVKILKNKSAEHLKSEVEEFEDKLKFYKELFINENECQGLSRAFLASLPRSGNTILRKSLEESCGIITGSDQNLNDCLTLSLFTNGFKGEAVANNRTWIGKTHYPYQLPNTIQQSATKTILLVRNPIDTIASEIHFCLTQTHDRSFKNTLDEEFPTEWQYMVQFYAKKWKQFIDYWVTLGQKKQLPVYIVRYEDFLADKEKTLKDIYSFILGEENIEGTYLDYRIKSTMAKELNMIYTPRKQKNQKGLGKLRLNDVVYIQKLCHQLLFFLGYASVPGQESRIGTFQFPDATDNQIRTLNGFKGFNKEQKDWYLQDKAKIDETPFEINKAGQGLEVQPKDEPFMKFYNLRMSIKLQKN